jgi:hypothetical protein
MQKIARSSFGQDKRNVVIPSAVEESLILTASIFPYENILEFATGALTNHIFSSLGLPSEKCKHDAHYIQ